MVVDWWTLSILNAAYSTFVLGGILWYKMHRLRTEVQEDYRQFQEQMAPMTLGADFLKEHLTQIEEAQTTQEAQLREIESQLGRMGKIMEQQASRKP